MCYTSINNSLDIGEILFDQVTTMHLASSSITLEENINLSVIKRHLLNEKRKEAQRESSVWVWDTNTKGWISSWMIVFFSNRSYMFDLTVICRLEMEKTSIHHWFEVRTDWMVGIFAIPLKDRFVDPPIWSGCPLEKGMIRVPRWHSCLITWRSSRSTNNVQNFSTTTVNGNQAKLIK